MKAFNSEDKTLIKIKELYEFNDIELTLNTPRAYDISSVEVKINQLHSIADKTKVMLKGRLENFRVKGAGRFTFIYADLLDKHLNKQICQWASSNSAAHAKMIAIQSNINGKYLQIQGLVSSFDKGQGRIIMISNPTYSEINSIVDDSLIPEPTYLLKGTTKSFEMKNIISMLIENLKDDKYSMTKKHERELGLMPLKDALWFVHGTKAISLAEVEFFTAFESIYHKRVRLEKIYRVLRRLENDKSSGISPVINYSKKDMQQLEESLAFTLTRDQKLALGSIFNIFKSGTFKTMLLQADVGAGKTVTAIFATFSVYCSGYQTAVLAPSAVLAQQLFDEFNSLLKPLGVEVKLIAGKTTKKQKEILQKRINENSKIVVIGTTSVNNLNFSNLGLTVFDEEQKFGVDAKRKLLITKNKILPYQIYMSATPLPRSLQSSIYGNYEVIKIKSKPSGRIPVKSKIIKNEGSAKKLFNFIESEAKEGRVSLIIAPSINMGELASVEKISKICDERFGKDFYRSIHGQLKEKEIQRNIKDFRNNKFSLMIATSMVEAGFSHSELSSVVVLGPDRFGIAQLHQMRGRAGRRAGINGYCALYPLNFQLKEKAFERLNFFCSSNDGFELANKDMQLRGSGDLIGKAQSGGEINFVEYVDEVELIKGIL